MSFKYDLTANQQTPTSDSKVVLCKSFKIDIAAGSGFVSGTTYDLGWLPKDAQVVFSTVCITTTVSGGTVSAATLALSTNGQLISSGTNVFTSTNTISGPGIPYTTNLNLILTDQKITYTPTLTGAGATAGVIYVTLYYVV